MYYNYSFKHGGKRGLWKNDQKLQNDFKNLLIARNIQRLDILDFMGKDYNVYEWSLRALDRRLKHFGITYIDAHTPLEVAKEAVKKEFDGPDAMFLLYSYDP